MSVLSETREALWAIPPYGMDNVAWVNVGMAWQAAGGDLAEWESWSRQDAEKFREGECARRWRSFKDDGGVTEKTLFSLAYRAGWNHHAPYVDDKAEKRPQPLALTPAQQLRTCLETLFLPDEQVCIVTDAARDDRSGKMRPSGAGACHRVGDLLDALDGGTVEDAIGPYDPEAGAWFCPNPVNGNGHRNEDVTAFRHALVESDELPIADQERIVEDMALPVSSLTLSGGKSAHALVKVDADGPSHYAERVATLYAACEAAGLAVDGQNKNPGRLSRLPGVKRAGQTQRLLYIRRGASSWDGWQRARNPAEHSRATAEGLPPIRALDLTNMPPLRHELIEGVLRQGHVMMLGGPSKAGKTQSLVELAAAIATGTEWFGLHCERGRVLYIDGETDPASFAHRFAKVAERSGIGTEDVMGGVDVWSLRGKAVPLQSLVPRMVRAASGRGYAVLIIDPAYPFMDGDENSAGDVRGFCNALTELSERLGCSVVYDHHHSKGAQGDKASIDRVSGSGMFSRHADAIMDMVELVPNDEQAGQAEECPAFRVSATLREFPPMRPFNVWFNHPIHVRDRTGELDGWEPMTAARAGGKSSGGKAKFEKLGKIAVLERIVDNMRTENGGQPIPFRDLLKRFDGSENTLRKYLDESLRYRRESGPNSCVIVSKEG